MNHTQSGSYAAPAPKFCIKCGGGLAPGAKFCTKCGSPVQPPAQQAAFQESPVQQAIPVEPPVQQTPPQEPPAWQPPAQQTAFQEPPLQQAVPVELPVQQAPPQEPPAWQVPAQNPAVQQKPPKKKSFFKIFIPVLAGILLITLLAAVTCKLLIDRGILQVPEGFNLFGNSGISQTDSDKSTEEDESSGDDSEEQTDGQEAELPEEQEADYDINIWDARFPVRPATVYQQYYVIYYEGGQNNRIDMAVFDLAGALNGNYLLWDKASGSIALKDYSAMTDCSRYCYDGSAWVKDADKVRWISDSAANIISSNLDVHDWDSGRLFLSHITSAGISAPIDYSYYQTPAPEPAPAPVAQEYALPGSNSRYLAKEELAGFTADECRIARNEIYARHGRIFDDEGLQAYFSQFDWYNPQIRPEDFSDTLLNEYEAANLALILEYESEMGYR